VCSVRQGGRDSEKRGSDTKAHYACCVQAAATLALRDTPAARLYACSVGWQNDCVISGCAYLLCTAASSVGQSALFR